LQVKAARAFAALVFAALAATAGASASNAGLGFTSIPRHVVQGDVAKVSVRARSGSRCALSVRYLGGGLQSGLDTVTAAGGVATWSWRVPEDVQAGVATARVHCAGAGTISRKLVIVGRLVQPKIDVLKTGFTTKPQGGIGGTELSYGVILHNDSTTKQATGVSVQVNFVLADNNLLGTDSTTVSSIEPGSDYALGKMVTFPSLAPIARLEVVVTVDHYDPPSPLPTLANMHPEPQVFSPGYVGTVEGELQNTTPSSTLQSANLSAVVLDASGNILGGGNGIAFQQLPPGAREFVQLSSGFDPIPFDQAASVLVSVTSTWKQPGT